jgi:hypothetical protein
VKSLFKSIVYQVSATLLIGGVALSWTAGVSAQTGPLKNVGPSAQLHIKPRLPESEVIRLRAGQLPEVTLTSTILCRILASEISAQRGAFLPAGKTMLELGRELGDYRLARRALEFYLAGGNLPGALEASRVWLRLTPEDA